MTFPPFPGPPPLPEFDDLDRPVHGWIGHGYRYHVHTWTEDVQQPEAPATAWVCEPCDARWVTVPRPAPPARFARGGLVPRIPPMERSEDQAIVDRANQLYRDRWVTLGVVLAFILLVIMILYMVADRAQATAPVEEWGGDVSGWRFAVAVVWTVAVMVVVAVSSSVGRRNTPPGD